MTEVKDPETIINDYLNAKKNAENLIKPDLNFEIKKEPGTEHIDDPMLSSYERAVDLVRNGKVVLDTVRHVFIVDGLVVPRVIRLFPDQYCSCNGTRTCYHIIAAQLSIGSMDVKTKVPNATLFRRINRKAADKTSGRKKPRKNDVDTKESKLTTNYDLPDDQITSASLEKNLEK